MSSFKTVHSLSHFHDTVGIYVNLKITEQEYDMISMSLEKRNPTATPESSKH